MAQRNIDRRKLLKTALMGGLGSAFALEQLGGVPLFGTWLSESLLKPRGINSLDAYQMIGNALRGGPAFLAVRQAMAQEKIGWTLVDIKVVNHVATQLVFACGGSAIKGSAKLGTSKTALQAKVDAPTTIEPFATLKLNDWFAGMLKAGTSDGAASAAGNRLGLDASDIKDFDSDKVALQAFLGLPQIPGQANHSMKGLKLRQDLGDITLFAQTKGLIDSPLGISCFMMGEGYDKAEGSLAENAVLDGSQAERSVVGSRAVRDYVNQISQYVGNSYADRASIEQNMIFDLDRLVVPEPVLRKELVNSIGNFQARLNTLRDAANLETTRQAKDAMSSNTQSSNVGGNQGATSEFLGQCKYVAQSLELTGVPLRNFSLFLNTVDLDGKDYDDATNQLSAGQPGDVRAYSYTEGMRQLAMGLNVLAKKISEGKKMIVYVHSEGGRGAQNGDSKCSFAFVMGPRGAGMLDHALFADATKAASAADPALETTAHKFDGLMAKDGTADATSQPDPGDVGMGVIEFLEGVTGKGNVRADLAAADGRFIKLKRMA